MRAYSSRVEQRGKRACQGVAAADELQGCCSARPPGTTLFPLQPLNLVARCSPGARRWEGCRDHLRALLGWVGEIGVGRYVGHPMERGRSSEY